MTLHISEDFAACLVNSSIVSVILNTMPPRDPKTTTTMTRTKKMKRTSAETTSRRSFANQMITSDEAAN